ncbi:fumarylacetoacetase [Oceaniglobus trochenteri]|uniref:fumarylacetoacetase n=1 Tax=Oceaniglobus trochenteri TaxID=2763260 RepID=UPI001CFFBE0B|nr:fumarylacetoacetase [Oceaniglobus trochenteri]
MPLLPSWVASANRPDTPFPLNNLPYGVFSTADSPPRCGVAIGDMILDLAAADAAGMIGLGEGLFDQPRWNGVMALGPDAWHSLRRLLTALLAEDAEDRAILEPCLVPMADARLHLPFTISEFTDFYASRHHATNVGTMFRGAENALPPNWPHMPIGYNGRASTVVVSGTEVIRPRGQLMPPGATAPAFGASRKLDYELELGAVVGTGSSMGQGVTVDQADAMIFGYVLLNDWSARDIQAWEYQPLGPFQAKAFATTISPWIVTAAALAPFRCPTPPRAVPLLPHLADTGPALFDITLCASLTPENGTTETICETNFAEMYWSPAQMLAHHSSSGCAMTPGDLLGSGAVSGAEPHQRGCLLERTWNGAEPLAFRDGTRRSFLHDGDTITLTGAAHGDGYGIGFGECSGRIRPARETP